MSIAGGGGVAERGGTWAVELVWMEQQEVGRAVSRSTWRLYLGEAAAAAATTVAEAAAAATALTATTAGAAASWCQAGRLARLLSSSHWRRRARSQKRWHQHCFSAPPTVRQQKRRWAKTTPGSFERGETFTLNQSNHTCELRYLNAIK